MSTGKKRVMVQVPQGSTVFGPREGKKRGGGQPYCMSQRGGGLRNLAFPLAKGGGEEKGAPNAPPTTIENQRFQASKRYLRKRKERSPVVV